jgi:hypothetical protein
MPITSTNIPNRSSGFALFMFALPLNEEGFFVVEGVIRRD